MLIPTHVASIYGDLEPVAEALKTEVDRYMVSRPQAWHYVSRIKSVESYLQKLETGRVDDPRALEDFFACTVIVPTPAAVAEAMSFVDRFFALESRRPKSGKIRKSASDFRFDDLRLYGRLREPGDLPVGPMHRMLFEVQIKTLLTHAWGVATHDVVYKSTTTSWARDRIAFQLRAILEHVELAVNGVGALEKSSGLSLEGVDDERLNAYVQFIESNWPSDFVPPDVRRAATSIDGLAAKFEIDNHELRLAVVDSFDAQALPIGLSPVGYALQVIELKWPDNWRRAWNSSRMRGYSWLRAQAD